jgi:hypothetical protein
VLILNYNRLFKKFNNIIKYYAQKIDSQDYEDYMQNMSIYILKHIGNFNIQKSSLKYYFCLMVLTAYRKQIYDKTKQEIFENSFSGLIGDNFETGMDSDTYKEFIERVIAKLKDERDITIFYTLLYDKSDRIHLKISRLIGMPYVEFETRIKDIQSYVKDIILEYK